MLFLHILRKLSLIPRETDVAVLFTMCRSIPLAARILKQAIVDAHLLSIAIMLMNWANMQLSGA